MMSKDHIVCQIISSDLILSHKLAQDHIVIVKINEKNDKYI